MEEKLLEILSDLCEDDCVKQDLEIDMFEEGLLDSLAFAELLFSIEDNFGVIISPSEVQRDDINTPSKIIAYVKERL